MEFLRRRGFVSLATALTLLAVGYLVLFEGTMSSTGIVKALAPEVQAGLYQTAVAGLLAQSSSFSNWSIALLVACWVVLVNDGKRSQLVICIFVFVCGASLASLFFGQLLHQSVVNDIRIGQDPLDNSWSWIIMTWQYWATLLSALLVAGSIIWRHLND